MKIDVKILNTTLSSKIVLLKWYSCLLKESYITAIIIAWSQFNIRKFINIITHMNRLKKNNYDHLNKSYKEVDKTQYLFFIF